MQYRNILLTCAFFAGITACKTTPPTAATSTPSTVLQPYGPAWAALWQQRSSEYKALCFQAYNIARIRLDEQLARTSSRPLAIVTDIDETVLDNSPYTVHTALKGQGYTEKTWAEWTASATADTVPGALSFLQYAAAKGVHIFYISNRAETERTPTLQNLQRWHFPNADNEHLLLKTSGSGKESRRAQVAQTHNIILLMGDNLGDFSELFDKQPVDKRTALTQQAAADFGNKFIVLPNPMYGDWLPALFDFNYKRSATEMDSLLKQQLKDY
ncbi:5'-nucleotidase, lipoprotein e(P4) family [Chitinophaga rhizophila]|uniref:5'-nucleotidase, lipoprotein e(P4) family n=1 Tax=Chitinophaga rhizophila TaxID=2866212 RepID=A0ABS7GG10_9BACT|nr:5'-nucleotidase, lipoprotein e(P4) family [Chitinophaga rhizophila]MBW8685438.1 5'-nucleotidase, lipoprotein e(P4) family [Chitinophaga rhizophila]